MGVKEMEMNLMPYRIDKIIDKENRMNISKVEIPVGVKMLEADKVWEEAEGGKGIVIAVLDTGISKNHPFLKDSILDGKDFSGKGDYEDGNGHGSHVAGIIKQVAPNADLIIGKVLDDDGGGSYQSIIDGINWATNYVGANGERTRIINMSLGGSEKSYFLEQAILNAVSKGILVVVASGNEGNHTDDKYEYGYPSLYNECITVGAIDENEKMAGFSNEHLQLDVVALGVNVFSTYKDGGYAVLSGTSMATPHISSALALIIKIGEKQFKRKLTESEVFGLMLKTCCSLDYAKSLSGNGTPKLSEIDKHCK
jgi:major intracellular serine protease